MYIDVEKVMQGDKLFLSASDLVDFNTKGVIGSRITVVCPAAEYEKFSVKIVGKPLSLFQNIKPNAVVIFENLEGVAYVQNSAVKGSYSATGLSVKDGKSTLPSLT